MVGREVGRGREREIKGEARLEMGMLVNAFGSGFEEDMLDGAMALLFWFEDGALSVYIEAFKCESHEKLIRKDRDLCSLVFDTVCCLRYLLMHNKHNGLMNIRDTENWFPPSWTPVMLCDAD